VLSWKVFWRTESLVNNRMVEDGWASRAHRHVVWEWQGYGDAGEDPMLRTRAADKERTSLAVQRSELTMAHHSSARARGRSACQWCLEILLLTTTYSFSPLSLTCSLCLGLMLASRRVRERGAGAFALETRIPDLYVPASSFLKARRLCVSKRDVPGSKGPYSIAASARTLPPDYRSTGAVVETASNRRRWELPCFFHNFQPSPSSLSTPQQPRHENCRQQFHCDGRSWRHRRSCRDRAR
jgi:hypothetical protein